MQAIRNGVKTALRTPGKTGLFTAILLALAMLTGMAFCVFAAVRTYLNDCDAYYHTVATLEYLGRDYPDGKTWDEGQAAAVAAHADELAALAAHGSVLSFTPVKNEAVTVAGTHRSDPYVYDNAAAVLRVRVRMREKLTESYIAEVTETIYACRDAEGKMLLMRTDTAGDPDAPQPETDGDYLVCGHFFPGQNGYMWFLAEETPYYVNGEKTTLPAFTVYDDGAALADYRALARQMELRNDMIPLVRTASLPDVLPFHQQLLTVARGRYFTQEEYDTNARVCVITGRLAAAKDLDAGSRVRLSSIECGGNLYGAPPVPGEAAEYVVIGVTEVSERYPYAVYLPVPDEGGAITPVNGYLLGQYRLKNTETAAFLAAAAPLEAAGFRVTVYDQGYAAAVEPMREMLLISVIFLAVCLALAAAVLCLTSHVFVSRQREAAATMLALGSGRRHVHLYFLSAVLVPALPGTLLGCILSRALQGSVIRFLARFAARLAAQDLRFSASRIAAVRTLDFNAEVPFYVYLAAALVLIAGALLLTLAFSRANFKEKRKKKRRRHAAVMRAGRSSRYTGRLKYALLSIRRRRGGTAAVLLLGVAVSLFFGVLTASLENYRAQLAAITRDAVITGHATDSAGRETDGIAMPVRDAEYVIETGLLRNYNLTYESTHLRFLGVAERADGTVNDLPEPKFPEGAFAVETFFAQLLSEPELHKTNDIRTSPLFYYTPVKQLDFIEGWDETAFAGDERICAVPQTLMDEWGLQPGDTARFMFGIRWRGTAVVDIVDLKVAATYVSAAERDVIFAPLRCRYLYTRIGWINPDDTGMCGGFVFTLKNAADLPQLRQTLADAGFSPANVSARSFAYAVIDDETYLNTARSMERQIRYVGVLYDALYALAGILAAVLAWLMTTARRQEIALMRALGTQKGRIVLTFTAEQAILCGAGVLAGLGLRALTGPVAPLAPILAAAFFALWTLSALLNCILSVKKQAYAALTEPE